MKQLAAVVALALAVACGGGGSASSPTTPTPTPTPTATNRAPSISSMSFSPSFGIQQLTSFSYSASATDPDGDTVTYTWDIAGNPRTGSSGSISFSNGGTGTASLTVSDGKGGTATDSRTFTVGSMTGNWAVTNGCGTFNMKFTQVGTSGSGTLTFPFVWCNVPAGTTGRTDPAEPPTIDSRGKIVIRIKVGAFIDLFLRGQMDSTGRRVTGNTFGSGFNGEAFTMTKQ